MGYEARSVKRLGYKYLLFLTAFYPRTASCVDPFVPNNAEQRQNDSCRILRAGLKAIPRHQFMPRIPWPILDGQSGALMFCDSHDLWR